MSIALSLGNNLTTGGIFKPAAVNNTSVNNVTDFAGIAGGGTLVLLSTQTASASANISFTSGLDSTYDEYIFKFINMHPATDNVSFQFNLSTDGGSSYAVTKTSTAFQNYHDEADSEAGQAYHSSIDLAQSTSPQILLGSGGVGNGNDESASGYLHLFQPSSTTFVKHYIARNQFYQYENYSRNDFVAGYANTTSAVNAVQFTMSSGNIDDGIIKMYGVAKS
jgi:hypothetical protein